jgi:CelD/BcsL family acetyltransferase involved in cellulose biosynthesis
VTFRTPTDGSGGLELEPLSAVADARADWTKLAHAAANPFATVEWCEAWLDAVGDACRLRLFGVRRADGALAAILPLVIVRGRYVRKARFLGFGAANELGPIAEPTEREAATQALRAVLAETRREWDVFLGESLPGTGWAARVDGTLVGRTGSPVLRGTWDSWDAYLASRSHNLRQELRRKERRLGDAGLRYGTVSTPAELEPALDVLFLLHRARWGGAASPWFAGEERLHRAFAAAALERGWLRLRLLELEGRPVAVYYGFRFGDAEWFYQLGRDPNADGSVGLLVVAHAIREALEDGAVEFKLGPGAQPYKLRFATDDPGLETVGIASGLRGRASLLAAARRAG